MKTHLSTRAPWKVNGATYFTNESGERVCTGSQNGRREAIPPDVKTVKILRLVRVRINSGGYDQGGAYWGTGSPLYCALGESDTEQAETYFRASDRADAKRQALAKFPHATFFR